MTSNTLQDGAYPPPPVSKSQTPMPASAASSVGTTPTPLVPAIYARTAATTPNPVDTSYRLNALDNHSSCNANTAKAPHTPDRSAHSAAALSMATGTPGRYASDRISHNLENDTPCCSPSHAHASPHGMGLPCDAQFLGPPTAIRVRGSVTSEILSSRDSASRLVDTSHSTIGFIDGEGLVEVSVTSSAASHHALPWVNPSRGSHSEIDEDDDVTHAFSSQTEASVVPAFGTVSRDLLSTTQPIVTTPTERSVSLASGTKAGLLSAERSSSTAASATTLPPAAPWASVASQVESSIAPSAEMMPRSRRSSQQPPQAQQPESGVCMGQKPLPPLCASSDDVCGVIKAECTSASQDESVSAQQRKTHTSPTSASAAAAALPRAGGSESPDVVSLSPDTRSLVCCSRVPPPAPLSPSVLEGRGPPAVHRQQPPHMIVNRPRSRSQLLQHTFTRSAPSSTTTKTVPTTAVTAVPVTVSAPSSLPERTHWRSSWSSLLLCHAESADTPGLTLAAITTPTTTTGSVDAANVTSSATPETSSWPAPVGFHAASACQSLSSEADSSQQHLIVTDSGTGSASTYRHLFESAFPLSTSHTNDAFDFSDTIKTVRSLRLGSEPGDHEGDDDEGTSSIRRAVALRATAACTKRAVVKDEGVRVRELCEHDAQTPADSGVATALCAALNPERGPELFCRPPLQMDEYECFSPPLPDILPTPLLSLSNSQHTLEHGITNTTAGSSEDMMVSQTTSRHHRRTQSHAETPGLRSPSSAMMRSGETEHVAGGGEAAVVRVHRPHTRPLSTEHAVPSTSTMADAPGCVTPSYHTDGSAISPATTTTATIAATVIRAGLDQAESLPTSVPVSSISSMTSAGTHGTLVPSPTAPAKVGMEATSPPHREKKGILAPMSKAWGQRCASARFEVPASVAIPLLRQTTAAGGGDSTDKSRALPSATVVSALTDSPVCLAEDDSADARVRVTQSEQISGAASPTSLLPRPHSASDAGGLHPLEDCDASESPYNRLLHQRSKSDVDDTPGSACLTPPPLSSAMEGRTNRAVRRPRSFLSLAPPDTHFGAIALKKSASLTTLTEFGSPASHSTSGAFASVSTSSLHAHLALREHSQPSTGLGCGAVTPVSHFGTQAVFPASFATGSGEADDALYAVTHTFSSPNVTAPSSTFAQTRVPPTESVTMTSPCPYPPPPPPSSPLSPALQIGSPIPGTTTENTAFMCRGYGTGVMETLGHSTGPLSSAAASTASASGSGRATTPSPSEMFLLFDSADDPQRSAFTLRIRPERVRTVPRGKIARGVGFSMHDWSGLVYQRQKASRAPSLKAYFSGLPRLRIAEIAKHNRADDLWIVIRHVVYDCTLFSRFHPGGAQLLVECAGKDATQVYDAFHPWIHCESMMGAYAIGLLTEEERATSTTLMPST